MTNYKYWFTCGKCGTRNLYDLKQESNISFGGNPAPGGNVSFKGIVIQAGKSVVLKCKSCPASIIVKNENLTEPAENL